MNFEGLVDKKILAQWEKNHKQEVIAVKQLGEIIGYGNMMSIASALWGLNLKENQFPISGAFIPTVTNCMKKRDAKKALEEQERRMECFKKILKNDSAK